MEDRFALHISIIVAEILGRTEPRSGWRRATNRPQRFPEDQKHRDPGPATNDIERQDLLLDLCRKVSVGALHTALACEELAQMMSMFSACRARPNWVMPSPPTASFLLTRNTPCSSE